MCKAGLKDRINACIYLRIFVFNKLVTKIIKLIIKNCLGLKRTFDQGFVFFFTVTNYKFALIHHFISNKLLMR